MSAFRAFHPFGMMYFGISKVESSSFFLIIGLPKETASRALETAFAFAVFIAVRSFHPDTCLQLGCGDDCLDGYCVFMRFVSGRVVAQVKIISSELP